MNVAPGADYTSRLSLGPDQTGLVGTIRFRLIDNDAVADDPVYGPSALSIIEDPTGSGIYLFRGAAPQVAGVYTPAWDTGPGTELYLDESLVVTTSVAAPIAPGGRDYITAAQLKKTLEMTGLTFADDDISTSISAASRAIDYMTNRHFWKDNAPTTRTYIPRWSQVDIDDLITCTGCTATIGSNIYSMTRTSDYELLPLNASADGRPYETLRFLYDTAVYVPDFGVPSLAVSGTFGWPSIPESVVAATTILATRILRRQREAPFGIVTVGIEQGAVARIAQTDPDVQALLSDFMKGKVLISLA